MPVSTRRMRARWPPVDESAGGNVPMTLPPELYWNYIRPFTPVVDRAILNKRTGSTRFYAGDRVQVDEQYLEENHKACRGYKGILVVDGKPGSRQLLIHIGSTNVECRDALEMLIRARKDWDTHLSNFEHPSERLKFCLDLLCKDRFAGGCPLLFCGEGKVEDVVALHASMNRSSINEPLTKRCVFPNTHLGYWIDRYLAVVIKAARRGFVSGGPEDASTIVIKALLDAGADITPFLDPLKEIPPVQSTNQGAFYLQKFRPGISALQCMKEFSESFEEPIDGDMVGIGGLDWVVAQIEAATTMSRFFEVSKKCGLVMEWGTFCLPPTPENIFTSRVAMVAYKLNIAGSGTKTPEQILMAKIVDEWNFVRDPRSKGDIRKGQVFYHPDFNPHYLPARPLRKLDEEEKKSLLARSLPPHAQQIE